MQQSFVALAGIAWKILVESIEEDAADIGDDHLLTVRYEDFLKDPKEHLIRILGFGGLKEDADFLAQIRRTRIVGDRKEAFRNDLSPQQLAQLDSCIGDKLRDLGYD